MATKTGGDGQPECGCGMRCWNHGQNPAEPCWGNIGVSEDYGYYVHFCDGHGHPEDGRPYLPNPTTAIPTGIITLSGD